MTLSHGCLMGWFNYWCRFTLYQAVGIWSVAVETQVKTTEVFGSAGLALHFVRPLYVPRQAMNQDGYDLIHPGKSHQFLDSHMILELWALGLFRWLGHWFPLEVSMRFASHVAIPTCDPSCISWLYLGWGARHWARTKRAEICWVRIGGSYAKGVRTSAGKVWISLAYHGSVVKKNDFSKTIL